MQIQEEEAVLPHGYWITSAVVYSTDITASFMTSIMPMWGECFLSLS